MSVKDLLRKQHGTAKTSGRPEACQTYVAEDWIMSDDIGYSGDDWGCCEETAATNTGSGWMGVAGFALSIVALGTALYAAFAPRGVVERARQKVESAAARAASQARELAETTRETVSGSGSPMGAMGGAPGL